MKSPTNPDREIRADAIQIFQSIQIAALREIVSKIVESMQATIAGKTADQFLRQQCEINIRNVLRHQADIDPNRAEKLLKLLLEMNGSAKP
jgi:hypothetical protein